MLKTVVLLVMYCCPACNVFVNRDTFFQDSLMNRKFKRTALI